MRHLTARTAVVAAVATVAALLAAPVAAAPTWVDPPDVADTGDQITQLQVRGGGVTYLAWVDAATDHVVASYLKRGQAWSAPVVIASPTGTPRIEAVYDVGDGFNFVYSTGSTLSSVTFRPDPLPSQVPVTTPRTLSSAYVAGTVTTSDYDLVWGEEVGGGQQRLVTLLNDKVSVVTPAAARTFLDTAATVFFPKSSFEAQWELFAYVAETGGTRQLYLQTPYGTKVLGRSGSTFSDLSFSDTGNLTWVEKAGSAAAQVRVAQVSDVLADNAATTVADVPSGPGDAADPSIVKLAGAGRVLVWREQDGATWSIRSSTAAPTGTTWTAPTTLDSGAGTLADDQFTARSGASGQGASWCHLEAGTCSVRGAFRTGKTWGPVKVLGTVAPAAIAHLADPGDPRFDSGGASTLAAWTDGSDDVRFAAVDDVGPTTVLKPKPVATFTGGVSLSWSATDDWSDVASYRIATSVAPFRGVVDYGVPWHQGAATAATQRRLPVGPGQTRCYEVRATDAVGNTGRASSNPCIIAPIDDRLLTRSASWRRVHDSLSYGGTLLRSDRRGATLTVRNYPWSKVLVLVRRLPSGGKIEVLLNGTRIRTLSTAGTSRRITALEAPTSSSKYRNLKKKNRTLQIRVITNGKPVLIDGLFLGANMPSARQINELTR